MNDLEAIGVLVLFLVYVFAGLSDLVSCYTNNKPGKYIEITEHGFKLVEPSKNYQAIIRFDEINKIRIFNADNLVSKLDLHLSNTQKVRISGYEGLTQLAEVLRSLNGIGIIET